MVRAAALVALLARIVAAACPESATERFRLSTEAEVISTVYPQADGMTVVRTSGADGGVDETIIDRGLLTLSERGALAAYTVGYRGDVDAIFAFEPGA